MLLTEPKNLWMIFTADSDSVCEGSNPSPAAIKAFGNRRRPFFLSCKFIAQKAGGDAERPLLLFAEKVGPAGIKAGPFFHNMQ